jgi:hypothetical protein
VVLGIEHRLSKEAESAGQKAAEAILKARGNSPRIYQNTLVFLAVDKTRLQDLDEAVRKYLAWTSILDERIPLNLDPHQARQAEVQRDAADKTVTARIPEAYQWLLVPAQANPKAPLEWQAVRLSGSEPLAVRAANRLRREELLISVYGPTNLRKNLDDVPLWRGDHVEVRQLVDDFARYVYLPRMADASVVVGAVRDGVGLLTWMHDGFAFADSFDEVAGRYRGLRGGQNISISGGGATGLVVKTEVARNQLEEEADTPPPIPPGPGPGPAPGPGPGPVPPPPARLTRFYGAVEVDAVRLGAKAGEISEAVVAHLAGLPKARVRVTLEVEAEIPEGASDQVVRIVTENCRTLKFKNQGFEVE